MENSHRNVPLREAGTERGGYQWGCYRDLRLTEAVNGDALGMLSMGMLSLTNRKISTERGSYQRNVEGPRKFPPTANLVNPNQQRSQKYRKKTLDIHGDAIGDDIGASESGGTCPHDETHTKIIPFMTVFTIDFFRFETIF